MGIDVASCTAPRSKLRAIALAGVIVATIAGPARAERYVIVNGQRLNDGQIAYLEQLACTPIANGSYWLNTDNGVWGYWGDPRPRGYLGEYCTRPGRRPSLSERGKLFSPYDWVR